MGAFDQLQSQFDQLVSAGNDQQSTIQVEGVTEEEALENASQELNIPISDLEYEVIQRGSGGFLGFGKKKFILEVRFSEADKGKLDEMEAEFPEEEEDPNGKVRVIIRKSGAFMRVSKPQPGGEKVTMDQAMSELAQKNLKGIDKVLIKSIVDEATDEEVKIGEWKANPEWDQKANIELEADEMKASIILSKPILSGRILEEEEIIQKLKEKNIVYGIKEDKIKNIFDREAWEKSIVIAEGKEVENGKDAYIDFRFKTDHADMVLAEDEESGRVDFKEHSSIQNVVQGQIIAVKVPATQGQPGRTVTNKVVEATDGEDCEMIPGDNTTLSEDGLQIIAQTNGQAILERGVVKVEPVLTVDKVDLDTGNITFLGTVVVKGDVLDGFSVKASADIEVRGNVGKSELEAEHDIIIKQGINGKNEAVVKAANNIYSKFIESAQVIAENDVIVRENVMHSMVDAGARIICNGKKAFIIGGRARACQAIYTKNLGSDAYTPTKVEAGVDPKSLEKLKELEEELSNNESLLHEVILKLKALDKNKEEHGELSEKHEKLYKRSKKLKSELEIAIEELEADIEDLQNYLNNLDTQGIISVRNMVYPGVDLTIKDANLRVKNEFKSVTFVNEGGYIKPMPFQELEDKDLENQLKEMKIGGGSL
jgi:uncharacterized protein